MSETERDWAESVFGGDQDESPPPNVPGISRTVRERGKLDMELNACPFCGSTSLTVERDEFVTGSADGDADVYPFYFVQCECTARGPSIEVNDYYSGNGITHEQAILLVQEKWNSRESKKE